MIRKLSTIVIALFLALLFISNLFASNGTQIGTIGPRAIALGSNFRGLADDWSAMYYNPAGLTQLGKLTFGGSLGIILPRGSYTPYNYPTASIPFSGMYTDQRDMVKKAFLVPSLSVFYKPIEKLTVGLGVYAPFGLGTEFDIYDIPDGYGNTNAISKQNEHFSDHQVINIQPTIAYKLTEKISVGLGLSYIWGKMVLDQVALPLNPLLAVWADPNNAMLTGILGPINTDQYRLIAENNLDGDGSTYGANLGILLDVNDKISIGISGRFAMDLKLKGDMKQTLALPGDQTKYATITQVPAVMFPRGQGQKDSLAIMFSGQNVPESYTVEADLPLPWTIGTGIAYKASNRLTLTADISLTNWISWDSIEVKVEGGDNLAMKQDWKNTIEMGIGFELMALQKEAKKLFLLGGFYTVDTPAPDATMSPSILDPIRRYVITGGLGLDFGKISFNLSGEYVLFGDKDLLSSEYKFDTETGMAENYAGLYKFNAVVITLGTRVNL